MTPFAQHIQRSPSRLSPRSLAPARVIVCALFLVTLIAGLGARAAAQGPGDFIVIVNRQNSVNAASREFVGDAFLKKTSHWDEGEVIRPVDQRADSRVRRAFSWLVLKRTVSAVRNYWLQHIFSGGDLPPPELDSDDAVVGYVSRYPGSIGYVSFSARLGDTKPIDIR
jgi:ABC-type phosphate transport system substrate-binding protein